MLKYSRQREAIKTFLCSEVGMYLAMARVAHREGYPEIGLYWEKAAFEEAEHAAKFAELLGEVVTDSTKKNLEMRVDAENGATAGKFDLAKRAKAANLDAIHETMLLGYCSHHQCNFQQLQFFDFFFCFFLCCLVQTRARP